MSNSLAITKQYPAEQFNLLVPMQTVTEIADIQKPVMNVVQISTDLNDKEIYEQEKANSAWTDKNGRSHPATPARYALTKKGLTKLMRAAGIKILSSRPVVPSTCQKCANMNAAIGKPVRCGACPNKDVKYEVRISVPQLTGEDMEVVAHKEILVDDVVEGMSDKQRAEFLKFRNEMCESKALNRALRTAMQIKGTYLIEEFRKPFVVAYLVPNLDNPDVKAEAVKALFGAAGDIYGGRKTRQTIYVEDDYEEGDGHEAHNEPIGQPYTAPGPEPAPAAAPTQRAEPSGGVNEVDPYKCVVCGKALSQGVSRYSIEKFDIPLCMDHQREEEKERS